MNSSLLCFFWMFKHTNLCFFCRCMRFFSCYSYNCVDACASHFAVLTMDFNSLYFLVYPLDLFVFCDLSCDILWRFFFCFCICALCLLRKLRFSTYMRVFLFLSVFRCLWHINIFCVLHLLLFGIPVLWRVHADCFTVWSTVLLYVLSIYFSIFFLDHLCPWVVCPHGYTHTRYIIFSFCVCVL